MNKKIFGILVMMLLVGTIFSTVGMANKMVNPDQIDQKQIKTDFNNFIIWEDYNEKLSEYHMSHMELIYDCDYEKIDNPDFKSLNSDSLWHITTVDSFSGDSSLGCFDENNLHYINNMNFDYSLAPPTYSIEGAIDMVMEYYCKYITEDSNDYWGICLYDPATDYFFGIGSYYGYHPDWIYYSFNIKSAYDYWYNAGYFRNGDGSQSYDLRVGFVFIQSDEYGVSNMQAEANGDYWSGIYIDDVLVKRLTTNSPPEIPDTPSGPSVGVINEILTFTTKTIDLNGDNVKYGWDWDGNNIVDEWTSFYSSDQVSSIQNSWTESGTYYISVKAEDTMGSQSIFSSSLTLVITNKPDKPSLNGPSSGRTGRDYTYSALSNDPDDEQIYYWFDWGDNTNSGWIGPFNSGENCDLDNSWDKEGEYSIKVKAKDINEVESEWSDPIVVSMPKKKIFTFNPRILIWLFEHFPFI